jgi:hypothetical protein
VAGLGGVEGQRLAGGANCGHVESSG